MPGSVIERGACRPTAAPISSWRRAARLRRAAGAAAGAGPAMYTIAEDGTRLTASEHHVHRCGGCRPRTRRARRRRRIRRRQRAAVVARRPQHLLHAGRRHLLLAVPARGGADTGTRRGCRGDGRWRTRRRARRTQAAAAAAAATTTAATGAGPRRIDFHRAHGDRRRGRTQAGLRRSLARDEEPLLRSQDARRQLGRRQGQLRVAAAATSPTPKSCTTSSWR